MIHETREQALARVGHALADPTRCRLLLAIVDGVVYPAQMAEHLELSRANVSNHLACLRDCGLVSATYEAVSYTHLDVYKRQHTNSAVSPR